MVVVGLPPTSRVVHFRLCASSPSSGYSFFNPYKVDFEPVNVDELVERFESGAEVSPDTLYTVGLIGAAEDLVVVLGRGELDRPLQ